jgi:hypothetical protein
MTDDGPKRPNYKGQQKAPPLDPDVASAIMDYFAQHPEITRAYNQLLKDEGRTLEDQIPQFAAVVYHALGLPVPPELKEYLRENAADLPPGLRKNLWGLDLN